MTSPPHCFRHCLALASALLSYQVASAVAGEPATVALYTSTCSPKEDAALRQALEVELRAMQIEPRWGSMAASGAPAYFTLRAECDAANDNVALRLWSSEPELVLARMVALRDVAGPARARTLALVISEAIGPTLASRADPPARRTAAPRRLAPAASRSDIGDGAPSATRSGDAADSEGIDSEAGSAAIGSGATANAEASARSPRTRARRSLLMRANPYGQLDELYSTSSPYGMARGFRIGTGAQGRLAMRDSSVLLGLELATNGPLSHSADWAIEVSHSSSTDWGSALDVSWWSSAIGLDFVDVDSVGLAIGPRLSFGYLSISDPTPEEWSTERTLVSQLGLRGKLDVPFGERTSVQMTFSGHRTFGVYAMTPYTGLDDGLKGWVLSWGLGLGIGP